MNNPPNPTQTWAAAHASTVTRGSGPTRPPPQPIPVRLVSFTEIHSWPVLSGELRVAWIQSPGQLLVATASSDNNARIRDATTGQILHTLTGHADSLYSITWTATSSGQSLLATGSADHTARVWDATTGQLLHRLAGHDNTVNTLAFTTTPSGEVLLATGSEDHTARIWDATTGQALQTLTGHEHWVKSVSWARTGEGQLLLATGSHDNTARIWDATTGRTLRTLAGHTSRITSVAWTTTPDGQLQLASAGGDNITRIWDTDGTELKTLAQSEQNVRDRLFELSWAPLTDGRSLLATASDVSLSLWDTLTDTLLHIQNVDFRVPGYNLMDWIRTEDGRLLLATISNTEDGTNARIWEAILDPPVLLSQTEEQEPIVLESIEDITPTYSGLDEHSNPGSDTLACAVQPNGELLIASTTGLQEFVKIWNVSTGQLINSLDAPGGGYSFSWDPQNQSRLAVANGDGSVQIWNVFSGTNLRTFTGHVGQVRSVAWGSSAGGQLLATGDIDGTVRIWGPETGRLLHTLSEDAVPKMILAMAWAEGDALLASGASDGVVRIWNIRAGTLLRSLVGHTDRVSSVAWVTSHDGKPLLASASTGSDGTVRIWDPITGHTLRILTRQHGGFHPVAWVTTHDGQLLLATASKGDTTQVWDPYQAVELASLESPTGFWGALDWALLPDGDLRLVVADWRSGSRPARVYRVRLRPITGPRPAHANRPEPRMGRVLSLGAAGMWRPIGLVEDLIQVTAKDTAAAAALNDGRLGALANNSGIRQLRELGWPATARLAFVPLLTNRLTPQELFEPPTGESPAALRAALRTALATRTGAARPAGIEPGELETAAQEITDRIITLLTILGPRACTTDPLLPARLLHRAAQLPALNARQLRLMSAGELQREVLERARGTGSHEYNPGTAGLARSGPLNRLLPTQLALPHDLMTMRYLENHLLYRQHRAPAPPTPELLTLILDTSPPTYGQVEQVLRLTAHLLVVTLWEFGHQPAIVTLDDPESAITLARRIDLMRIWTTRTLDEPWPAIKTAIHTASATGHPVLLLTHHHTPRGGYHTSDRTRLLTAHHPPETPPDGRTHPYHHHLPPNPTRDELADAITGLLTQSRDRI